MRILHITPTISTEAGGVARSVQDTSKALALEGLDVEILTQNLGYIDLAWKDNPPPNLRLTLCPGVPNRRLYSSELKRLLPERIANCDVVHFHGMWLLLNVRAAKIARELGKPYVCSIRGMLDPWSMKQRGTRKRLFYKLWEKKRLAMAGAIHFTAEDELKKAQEWVPAGVRTVVVPNVINLELYMELPGREVGRGLFPQVPADGPWVLFLSRIHEKKGLNFLIEAIKKLPERLAKTQLIIAGSGEDAYVASLKAQAEKLGIAGRVHFVGMVGGAKKAALYRTAEVLAIPTSQENFGLVFPEALACETPVMLTEGVDIHREILAAGGGYLIGQDVAGIVGQLVEALDHPEENHRKGEAGRRWVLENLQPSAIAKQWRRIYGEVLG